MHHSGALLIPISLCSAYFFIPWLIIQGKPKCTFRRNYYLPRSTSCRNCLPKLSVCRNIVCWGALDNSRSAEVVRPKLFICWNGTYNRKKLIKTFSFRRRIFFHLQAIIFTFGNQNSYYERKANTIVFPTFKGPTRQDSDIDCKII